LEQSILRTQQLLAQAQRIAYDIGQIDRAFSTTYAPASSSLSDQALIANAQTRWQNAMAGFQDAMRTQATVVGNINTNRTQMSALVTSSQGATGALQASQAGNQLLALAVQQLADLTAVVAAHGRAQNLESALHTTAQDQSREQLRRFFLLVTSTLSAALVSWPSSSSSAIKDSYLDRWRSASAACRSAWARR
jgi:P-type conjugative transfer protein TrbJ